MHKWQPAKTTDGRIAFRARGISPVPIVRAHCTECKKVKHFTEKDWQAAEQERRVANKGI